MCFTSPDHHAPVKPAILAIALLLCTAGFLFGHTGDSTRYLTAQDTIFLSLDASGGKIFTHEIAPKQTLYSLARFYGLSVEELYLYNPGLMRSSVPVGQRVRIPIPNRAIVRYRDSVYYSAPHVPVYYVVRKGDTMFNICRRKFRMPIDTVMHRSGLPNIDIKEGMRLHVGWMSLQGVPEDYRSYRGGPLARRNAAMQTLFQQALEGAETVDHQGAAAWKKDAQEQSDFYALHRQAPINSVIKVVNPMTRKTAYVKVIGRIPDRAYEDNIVAVLSPLSAKALGAVDPRFFVKITYLEKD